MTTWQDKAHRLIGNLCHESYKQTNPVPGRKHKDYHVPELAKQLIECLNTDDEHRAKALFLSYDGLNAI